MRNIVKYDILATQGNSIKSGNFNLGVNDTPSTLTGFYNGITPINGGYTIYINKASNGRTTHNQFNLTIISISHLFYLYLGYGKILFTT